MTISPIQASQHVPGPVRDFLSHMKEKMFPEVGKAGEALHLAELSKEEMCKHIRDYLDSSGITASESKIELLEALIGREYLSLSDKPLESAIEEAAKQFLKLHEKLGRGGMSLCDTIGQEFAGETFTIKAFLEAAKNPESEIAQKWRALIPEFEGKIANMTNQSDGLIAFRSAENTWMGLCHIFNPISRGADGVSYSPLGKLMAYGGAYLTVSGAVDLLFGERNEETGKVEVDIGHELPKTLAGIGLIALALGMYGRNAPGLMRHQ